MEREKLRFLGFESFTVVFTVVEMLGKDVFLGSASLNNEKLVENVLSFSIPF